MEHPAPGGIPGEEKWGVTRGGDGSAVSAESAYRPRGGADVDTVPLIVSASKGGTGVGTKVP